MRTCILCGNSANETKHTRPGLHYHAFPKNAYRRRKWLEVLGMDHCYDWYRICSDHFLQENYSFRRPYYLLRDTIPRPYNTKCNDDGFLNKKKHFENAAVNNFKSPRQPYEQIKLATINDKSGYQKKPRIQTEQFETKIPVDNIQPVIKTFDVPVRTTTTKDYTFGNGLHCSIKNCSNRHSKDLSFFGYPYDSIMRKMWVDKTGLKEDFTEKVRKCVRVCAAHFDDGCFTNPEKTILKSDAIPSLFLDNDLIEASNIPSSSTVTSESIQANKSSCLSSNYVANEDSEETSILVSIDSTTRYAKDFNPDCRVPGCITNDIVFEDVALFASTIKCVNDWSSSLGLQLTVNSIVCERHFRPQDILHSKLMVNGVSEIVKSLVPHALPVRSACNPVPLKTNVVPILRTHGQQFKRAKEHNTDKNLFTKKIKNVLDNTDKCSTTNISKSIDEFSCIESNLKQKPKNISTNSPLSFTFEPIENSQVIQPSVKSTPTSSMSTALQQIPKHNLTSTINSNLPSVNLTQSFASTSSSSVYNLSQQSPLEQQNATSSLKRQGTLSSNSIIHPQFVGNQVKCLKPIPPTKKTHLPKQPKLKTPVISKCISIARGSGSTENVEEADDGYIFEISKRVQLPSLFWKIKYLSAQNITCFYQQDNSGNPVKEITFFNDFVPIVKIFGKKYNCNTPFKSKNQFQYFLEMIDNIKKCSGLLGFVNEKCIGYAEDSSKDIHLCSACQKLLLEDFQTLKSTIIKNIENKLAETRSRLLKLKK